MPKAPMGRGWVEYIHIRRNCTLWFWRSKNLAVRAKLSKTKQRERLMRCIVYSCHWFRSVLPFVAKVGELYTYTGVGLSALLVSTTWAMPEPLLRGTSDRTGSTFFCIYTKTNINIAMRMPDGVRTLRLWRKMFTWYHLLSPSHSKRLRWGIEDCTKKNKFWILLLSFIPMQLVSAGSWRIGFARILYQRIHSTSNLISMV